MVLLLPPPFAPPRDLNRGGAPPTHSASRVSRNGLCVLAVVTLACRPGGGGCRGRARRPFPPSCTFGKPAALSTYWVQSTLVYMYVRPGRAPHGGLQRAAVAPSAPPIPARACGDYTPLGARRPRGVATSPGGGGCCREGGGGGVLAPSVGMYAQRRRVHALGGDGKHAPLWL